MGESFSARLRAATWHEHEQTVGASTLSRAVAESYTVEDYALVVQQHLTIYRALESSAECHTSDVAAGFHQPVLARRKTLEHDLAALGIRSTAVLDSTKAYAERIREASIRAPEFIAHHYTRYLGDLSGGMFIGRALAQRFGEQATTFYRFEIADVAAYKRDYRRRLDGAKLSVSEQQTVIDESITAFRYNAAVLRELAALQGARVS